MFKVVLDPIAPTSFDEIEANRKTFEAQEAIDEMNPFLSADEAFNDSVEFFNETNWDGDFRGQLDVYFEITIQDLETGDFV